MHADVTAVTIQSNKITLYEVKDNQMLLEPLYGENQMNFLANPMFCNTLLSLNRYIFFPALVFVRMSRD